jgi:hypothetical protein
MHASDEEELQALIRSLRITPGAFDYRRRSEVRFRNDSADIRMIIRCTNGTPVYSLKD